MQITDVIGLKWLTPDKTVLGGMVMSPIFGAVPLCVHDRYDTETGQKIWDDALAGKYGPIFDYVKPEPAPVTVPKKISRRQFFQYLAAVEIISKAEAKAALQTGDIPTPLQTIIDQLPTEDDRFSAEIFVVGSQDFEREHWLTNRVREALGWTDGECDDFWRNAYKV
ncbi:hypothetical protein CQ054_05820 [Ochrobactrum sp. MYb29]|nr:hypothetical protein CQ054_05820 [Ochrobactrum sp. MYb29]